MLRGLGLVLLWLTCPKVKAVEVNSLAYTSGYESGGSEPNGSVPYYHRQARDYVPPGGNPGQVQYMTPPGSMHHQAAGVGQGGAYAPPAPAYSAPSQSSYASPGPIMMQGGYGVPSHYAIPPIVMGGSGGYGGDGGYGDDMGGGSDYKELIGLLGLKGLKGLKGVKAVKAIKGLGLLALSPILIPLLPLLPILILLPLLLPLLLLFLIPIPVITIPGRKKRSTNSPRSIFEDTMTSLASKLPPSLSQVPPAQLNECLDSFVCETGELVQRTMPSLMRPATWLLTSLWPAEMRGKVTIFQKANNCREKFKCRVKKLENLFTNVVFWESAQLKKKIEQKIGQKSGRIGWSDVVRVLFE